MTSTIPFECSNGSFQRDKLDSNSWNYVKQPIKSSKFGFANQSPLCRYYTYLTSTASNGDSNAIESDDDNNYYKVILDVHQFQPEDISLRTEGNTILIEGKHDDKNDNTRGLISRQFARKYKLPDTADMSRLGCGLSCDGVLQCRAPKLPAPSNNTQNELTPETAKLPDFHMVPFEERCHGNSRKKVQLLGVQSDGGNFKVLIDVHGFDPKELKVTATHHVVTIEGKHEEKADQYGAVARHFIRNYDLPKSVNEEDVQCQLRIQAGILEIFAPKHKSDAVNHQIARHIPMIPIETEENE